MRTRSNSINKVIGFAVISLLLTLSGFVTDAVGQAETFPEVLDGRMAVAEWTGQSGCVQRKVLVFLEDAVAVAPPASPRVLQDANVLVADVDTCANQVLLLAAGSTPLPPDAGIDRTLTMASVVATVELTCSPPFAPCTPFSVDIDLAWTGVGAIDRTTVAGNPFICPGSFGETGHHVDAIRSATVTGDVSSGGTGLLAGLAPDLALIVDIHSGSVITLPGDLGPFHPCHF